jgi:hypothetical protein
MTEHESRRLSVADLVAGESRDGPAEQWLRSTLMMFDSSLPITQCGQSAQSNGLPMMGAPV